MTRLLINRSAKLCLSIGVLTALLVTVLPIAQSEARIRCNGAYQVVRGHGEIATPYCEDNYIAQVARSYGIRVSNVAIRQSPSRKEEVCRAIGHDSRIYALCQKYRSDGCSGRRC